MKVLDKCASTVQESGENAGTGGQKGQQRSSSVSAAEQQSGNSVIVQNIIDYARHHFPNLIQWMESHFPGNSYQQALDLRREDFGKIQNSFTEVDTIEKLIKLGKSVCQLYIACDLVKIHGTGFVLFDNYILTNGHLFKNIPQCERDNTNMTARFNYQNDNESEWITCKVKRHVVIIYDELDYAVLELEAQNLNIPGLLKQCSDLPLNGEACIIGHPAGEVKKMDMIRIIEKEKREQAVNDQFQPYKDTLFIVCSISHLIKEQGIENIMKGGNKADKVVTNETFMYHSSSGSPVFDACGGVFGLHTAGFVYGFPNQQESVIEFAQSLLKIFEHFVSTLKERRQAELLEKVNKEVKGHSVLKKVFKSVVELKEEQVKAEPAEPEDSSDFSESMGTD
ncbi:serine protease FAM111A-like [Sander vitreus]